MDKLSKLAGAALIAITVGGTDKAEGGSMNPTKSPSKISLSADKSIGTAATLIEKVSNGVGDIDHSRAEEALRITSPEYLRAYTLNEEVKLKLINKYGGIFKPTDIMPTEENIKEAETFALEAAKLSRQVDDLLKEAGIYSPPEENFSLVLQERYKELTNPVIKSLWFTYHCTRHPEHFNFCNLQ